MNRAQIASMTEASNAESGGVHPQTALARMSGEKEGDLMTVIRAFDRCQCLLLRWNPLLSRSRMSLGSKQCT